MDLHKESLKAIRKAKACAKSGNHWWAQYWLDRAGQFWPVAKAQVTICNRLLKEARERGEADGYKVNAAAGYSL